jgi:pimeloyl-ACP methyl ester carboxylesterase
MTNTRIRPRLSGSDADLSESIHAPLHARSETPLSKQYDVATRTDDDFNRHFQHGFHTVEGLQMHYVIGGLGPQTLLFFHGFPQSWYEYREIMPEFVSDHTVIAIDLPGLGDTTGEVSNFQKFELAGYVQGLMKHLGRTRDLRLVAHDFGSGLAFAFASRYRDQVAGLFFMDFPLVGGSLTFDKLIPLSFHFSFFQQKPLAETLVEGREREFLDYFFAALSPNKGAMPSREVDEYVRVYSRPSVWRNGMEWYRAWPKDEVVNRKAMETPLTIPVRILTQSALLSAFLAAAKDAAPLATGLDAPGAGHWLVEERPRLVVEAISAFYASPRVS